MTRPSLGPNTTPLDVWQELLTAARDFASLKPWGFMTEQDGFGVRVPGCEDTAYCIVVGELGELLGLHVYIGAEALGAYEMMVQARSDADFKAAAAVIQCLTLHFGPRNDLHDEERAIFKQLGLTYRGSQAWPQFRDWRPGYLPWHLTEEQSRLMIAVLDQAAGIAQRFREDPQMLSGQDKRAVFVRTFIDGIWCDTWELLDIVEPRATLPFVPSDEVVKALKTAGEPRGELDLIILPGEPILPDDGVRPMVSQMVIWMDPTTGLILDFDVILVPELPQQLVESACRIIADQGMLPSRINMLPKDQMALLKPVADALGIRLCVAGPSRERAELLRAMAQFPHL